MLPWSGMSDADNSRLVPASVYHPFEKMCRITVLGRPCEVPEKNMLLRGFQYIAPETIPYGRFCWNEECQYCRIVYRRGPDQPTHKALSCKTLVSDGMEIVEMDVELTRCLKGVLSL